MGKHSFDISVAGTMHCKVAIFPSALSILSCDIAGDLNLSGNSLKSLPFSVGKITGDFKIDDNHLEILTGAPHSVGGSFYCRSNRLKSLEECPSVVGANFCCDGNELSSLVGLPKNIPGILSCSNNCISSLNDSHIQVGDTLNLSDNPLSSLCAVDKYLIECRVLVIANCPIQEGGVSLIKISNLREVIAFNTGDFERAAHIINKYLSLRNSATKLTSLVLKCKAELEREGLSQYGKI